jgi:2-polyprenyl-3-methyl-5-hydroxy-6-metoxy-1,4-benzoquinol methylase
MEAEQHIHWTNVYSQKATDSVSWYQPTPNASLDALDRFAVPASTAFIDVGGGASNLVDALVSRGWSDLTVLDIAAPALEAAKQRLGERAEHINWQVADITDWMPARRYGVWHDRAVFHFLTGAEQRAAYRRALSAGVIPGGLVIMATFALDGPERCSGLLVERYDPEKLAAELGPSFQLLDAWSEQHETPWASQQSFNWCAFRSVG